MSFVQLLTINGMVRERPSASGPYRFVSPRPGLGPVLKQVAEPPATRLELAGQAAGQVSHTAGASARPLGRLLMKVGFLLGLLVLCTGLVSLHSLSREKQTFALGRKLALQRARAEAFRLALIFHRGRWAEGQRVREDELRKYPLPPPAVRPAPSPQWRLPAEPMQPAPRYIPNPNAPAVAAQARGRGGAVPPAGAAVVRPVAWPVQPR